MSRRQERPAVRRRLARAIPRTIWLLAAAAACACRPSTEEAPIDAATLRVGVGQVATVTPNFGVRQLMQLLSVESLVRIGEDGRAQPWLAEGWTVANDGLSMTIRLRKGVTFHDGTPVTSNVVVDILRKALPPFMGA